MENSLERIEKRLTELKELEATTSCICVWSQGLISALEIAVKNLDFCLCAPEEQLICGDCETLNSIAGALCGDKKTL